MSARNSTRGAGADGSAPGSPRAPSSRAASVPAPRFPTLKRDEFLERLQTTEAGQQMLAEVEAERLDARRGLVERHTAAEAEHARRSTQEGDALAHLEAAAHEARAKLNVARGAFDLARVSTMQGAYGRELQIAAYLRALEALAEPEIDVAIDALDAEFYRLRDSDPETALPKIARLRRAQDELRTLKHSALGRVELAARIATATDDLLTLHTSAATA